MFHLQSDLWLGDEASLRHLVSIEQSALAGLNLPAAAGTPGSGEQLPRLYSRQGATGVITIRGGLVNVENDFTAYLGMSTYPAIRDAMVFAAHDDQVSKILLDIESPGGVVSGVNDVAGLIASVGQVKPITAFSDGLIASAAYWLASAADKIIVGQTAIVGSIGVISTIVSYHGSLQQQGIDVRVIRAGENKALGHPAEPITDKAVQQVQDRANAIYDIFTATVRANRPMLKAADEKTWAQGNEFLGADAVGVRLADSVSTFDRVIAQMAVDKSNSLHNTSATKIRGSDSMKPRAVLDDKLVALIATGASLTDEQKLQVEAARAADAAGAEVLATAEAAAKAAAEAKVVADAKAAADAQVAADAKAAETLAGATEKVELVKYLEAQLETTRAALTKAEAEAKVAKDAVAVMQAPHDALVSIARDSINKMTIALGGSEMKMEGISGQEIAAKHATVLVDFNKRYPVGGVAASAVDAEDKPVETAVVTSFDQARRRMASLDPKK